LVRSEVLALIPAYDEAQHIAAVVTEAARRLPVLVVDDGSTDGTSALAEAAGAEVLRYTPNRGKGVALRRGFRWALEQGYDAVVTLDADGQHDAAEITAFLRAFEARRGDLIIGARDFRQIPPVRRVANDLGSRTLSWALGRRVRDNQSGYRLLSRRLVERVVESEEAGFEFEVEVLVTCVLEGFALDWVPIRTIYAGESSHIDPWHHLVNFLRLVWATRRRVRARGRGDGAWRPR
jgi:glycosyltransferase involved in cell wall biosynthesis